MIESIEEGRKEDGNRSIADKILNRLHDLEKIVETNYGRWAWELLQNAKDSVAIEDGRKVSVKLELSSGSITFKHNGRRFTEKDVRGIINQISSKEIEDDEENKTTGKFGTGFLTTHILSKVIEIKGILETVDNKFYKFEFPLDREGKTTKQLIPKIENAWASFHDSATEISEDYNKNRFNTSFSYKLDSDFQQEIAEKGIEEFSKLIPYVLTFIPIIEKVRIVDNIKNQNIQYKTSQHSDFLAPITCIERKVDDEIDNIYILNASNDRVSIATEIEKVENGYEIKDISKIPKLFCDFPLIGSENFNFPTVINSFFFNPLTERDGIWLKGDSDSEVVENKELIEGALELYEELLNEISNSNFFNFFNITNTKLPSVSEKYFDTDWYKTQLQKPLRSFIKQAKIVEMEGNGDAKNAIGELWFPASTFSKEIQDKIWKYNFDLFPESVCKRDHFYKWNKVSWNGWQELDYEQLVNDLEELKNIDKLSENLGKDELNTFNWYNSLCSFLLEDDANLGLFERKAIIPNQNRNFKKKNEIYIDEIKDNELVDILELLGEDWKEVLIYDYVSFGRYHVKKKSDIATAITEKLKKPSYKDEDFIEAISLLSEWFENNTKESKELFTELYRRRAELFMNTIEDKESLYKVMRSKTNLSKLSEVAQALENNPELMADVKKSREIDSLLSELKLENISELRKLLVSSKAIEISNSKTEITPDILVSLGVTSIDELEEALQDKDLSAIFKHTSTPNVDMFLKAQKLISRAKSNIIKHLKTLSQYDCTEIEELATTVIGGVKKDGLEIHIVIRPSDNGEVIVYYSSEKDTLDYENAELWIDNGIDTPRHLTLGKILKTTGINKIPV
ncbi:MAG: hypothetical protein PHW82_12075 [Bacteroidales bacterium]|nr:hypothetical protein [Bacteroidales bacterium]